MYAFRGEDIKVYTTNQLFTNSSFLQSLNSFNMKFASLALLASVLTAVSATVVPGASTPLFYLVASSTTSSANLLVSSVPPLLPPPTLTIYIARPPIRQPRHPLLRYPCSPILLLRRLTPRSLFLHLLPPDLLALSTLQSLL